MNWQYLAGFFDGEGGVYIRMGGGSISPRIQISQAGKRGEEVLKEIGLFYSSNGIEPYRLSEIRGESKTSKEIWVIVIEERCAAMIFLRKIIPYLVVKRVEAQDIFRFLSIYPKLPRGPRPGDWKGRGKNRRRK